jgi:class 3 adenylate cyclase
MEAPPLERRLAAILAADVEGHSRLMHGDEEATMATLSAAGLSSMSSSRNTEAGLRTRPAIAC